jgi:hypothetical protein
VKDAPASAVFGRVVTLACLEGGAAGTARGMVPLVEGVTASPNWSDSWCRPAWWIGSKYLGASTRGSRDQDVLGFPTLVRRGKWAAI